MKTLRESLLDIDDNIDNVDGNVELKLSVKDMYFFDSLTEENLLYIV